MTDWNPIDVVILATGKIQTIKSKAFNPSLHRLVEAMLPVEDTAIVSEASLPVLAVVVQTEVENVPSVDSVPSDPVVKHQCCGSKGFRHLKSCTNETRSTN